MQRLVLAVLFWLVAVPPFANGQSVERIDEQNYCDYVSAGAGRQLYSFASDKAANAAVHRIVEYTGLQANFEVRSSNVENAAAVVRGGTRFILYNQEFMLGVADATRSNWSSVSILAHEIGHHLQGHTLDGGSRPERELEADNYSGFVLYKMGASLSQAKAAIETLVVDESGSATHPGRSARLAAITNGWLKAKELGSPPPAPSPSSAAEPAPATDPTLQPGTQHDDWWHLVFSKRSNTNQTYGVIPRNQMFEENIIDRYWGRDGADWKVTSISFGGRQDHLVAITTDTGFSSQGFFADTSWPRARIAAEWEDDRYITSVNHDRQQWVIGVSEMRPDRRQSWKKSAEWPMDWIKGKWKEGQAITEVTRAKGEWVVVMTSGTGTTEQRVELLKTTEQRDRYIQDRWSAGFAITELSGDDEHWVVVMSKGNGLGSQSVYWQVRRDQLSEVIRKRWDEGYDITEIF